MGTHASHVAVVPEEMWAQFGPGAVGVGWDGALLRLELHLRGGTVGVPIAWQLGPEGRDFNTRSSVAWGEANLAAGADDAAVEAAVANTTEFYAPASGAVGMSCCSTKRFLSRSTSIVTPRSGRARGRPSA